MSTSALRNHTWMRPAGPRAWIDGGTLVVVLIWFGILALIPSQPEAAFNHPPVPHCIIRTWSAPFHLIPLAQRPDLVTFSSAASFGAGGPAIDSLQGVPPLRHYSAKLLPDDVPQQVSEDGESADVMLRRAAADELVRQFDMMDIVCADEPIVPRKGGLWNVQYSPSLGNTRLAPAFERAFMDMQSALPFEADLWLAFDADGRPVEIFIERCDARPVVQEFVRLLWNPEHWLQAEGLGRLSIRFYETTGDNHES